MVIKNFFTFNVRAIDFSQLILLCKNVITTGRSLRIKVVASKSSCRVEENPVEEQSADGSRKMDFHQKLFRFIIFLCWHKVGNVHKLRYLFYLMEIYCFKTIPKFVTLRQSRREQKHLTQLTDDSHLRVNFESVKTVMVVGSVYIN